LEKQIESKNKKINEIEYNLGVLESEKLSIINSIEMLSLKTNNFSIKELETFHELYKSTSIKLSNTEQQYTLLSNSIDSKHSTIKQISKFKHNPSCEVCVDNNRSKLQQIGTLNSQINELTSQSVDLVVVIEQCQTQLNSLKEKEELFISIKSDIFNLDQEKLNLFSCETKIDKNQHQLLILRQEIENLDVQLEQIDVHMDSLKKNEFLDNKISEIKNALTNSKKKLSIITSKKLEVHSNLKIKENNQSTIIDQLQEMSEIEKEFESFRYYLEVVGKDGLPYTLISKTIPGIETEINRILSQIVPFSIALDIDGKNFGGKIVYDHETSWPLENSSGMERFISSLAIRVALLKASNLPKSNFLIIDEGMGSLDSEYLHGMQLMFDLLKEQFDYIIVISHLDSIRDMVDNILEIKKINGYSYINTTI
jgi:DNA repair exonuclease SbcCD ATPase subunit